MALALMVPGPAQTPRNKNIEPAVATEALVVTNPIRFEGEVRRGDTFRKELSRGLVFRLLPSRFGWIIQVVESQSSDRDYSAIATPPFRGINALQVKGWHFRNAENSGPNNGSLNAPQEVREFCFYVRRSDYEKGSDCLKRLLWPGNYLKSEVDIAEKVCRDLWSRTADGRLTILDLELGNLMPGQQAWIEHMKFAVELRLPRYDRQ